MRHEVFDRFILNRFPRPSNGKHIAPLALRIVAIALHHHLHILLRTTGRIALDHHDLGPRWWVERPF
jgi:hypothetical protein